MLQVITLDGKVVWRRRHYRVRRAEEPGTFHFSVLDNGVISKEYWRIVHVNEDFSWGLFYYAGAASVVGQAYRGKHWVSENISQDRLQHEDSGFIMFLLPNHEVI